MKIRDYHVTTLILFQKEEDDGRNGNVAVCATVKKEREGLKGQREREREREGEMN